MIVFQITRDSSNCSILLRNVYTMDQLEATLHSTSFILKQTDSKNVFDLYINNFF